MLTRAKSSAFTNFAVDSLTSEAERQQPDKAATAVAHQRDARALILEMPYTAIYDVAKRQYPFIPPFDVLPDNNWRTIDRVDDIQTPLLVLHGEKDELIPVEHGRRVFDASASPVKEIEIYPLGTHFNLHDFGAEGRMRSFLEMHVVDR